MLCARPSPPRPWDGYGELRERASVRIASTRLFGRMSVQCCSTSQWRSTLLGAHSVCGRFARASGLICTAAAIGVRAGAVAPDRLEQSLRAGLAAGSLGREQTVNSSDLHVVESK